jgi:hypothetical protein
MRGQIGALRKSGQLKPKTAVAVSTVIMEQSGGRLVAPPAQTRAAGGRAFGGGALTFRFSGFSAADVALMRPFVDLVYERIVNLYGAPAASGEVEILNIGDSKSDDVTVVQLFAFGAYNASTNQILLPRYSNTDVGQPINSLRVDDIYPALLLNMIHAFHGAAVLSYDAWEQGMARAAASVIARDPAVRDFVGARGATFFRDDPTASFLLSLLQVYDLLNQPALGNRTFFPSSQSDVLQEGQLSRGKMLLARIGMSGAAWLKIYIENTSFFRDFNAEYYAQVSGNPNLAGNVPALRALAGSKLPGGVEGIPFDDWFTQQYILDTSVSVGTKVYAFIAPFDPDLDGSELQSASIVVNYYNSRPDGDEILLNGQAFATYLDYENAPIQAGAGAAPVEQGEAIFTFVSQASGVGRYSLNFAVGGLVARTYLPIGFSADFQGVVAGVRSLTGSVDIQQVTLPPVTSRGGSTAITNDAFGRNLGSPSTDLSKTTVTVTTGTTTSTHRRNTGDGRYFAVLRPLGTATTVTRAFPQTSLPNLVSFPVRPLSVQPEIALGLPPTDFLLTRWDNPTSSYSAYAPGQPSSGRLEPGTGYWLKVGGASSTATVRLTGTPPPSDTDYAIAVPLGWSLIGSPFGTDINLSDISVQYRQDNPVSWDDAVGDLVQAQVYEFDQAAGYRTTDVLKGSEWKGYWIRSYVPGGVTLIVPGPDSPTRSQAVRSAITRSAAVSAVPKRSVSNTQNRRPEWAVRMTAEQNIGGPEWANRETVTLGAAKDATRGVDLFWDKETPPAIAPGVQATFTDTGTAGRATGGHRVADFRDSASATRSATWDLSVTTPVGGVATLRWEGVGTVPRRTRLTLVDTVNGTRIPLKSRSSYTWTGEAGKSRAFRILSEPERSLPLAITNVNFSQGRNSDGTRSVNGGSGIGLTYTIVGEADPQVAITISSPLGKIIRRLDGGAPSDASRGSVLGAGGAQQRSVRWDGRSEDGGSLPLGAYTVTITARGSDGTIARVQRPVLMAR